VLVCRIGWISIVLWVFSCSSLRPCTINRILASGSWCCPANPRHFDHWIISIILNLVISLLILECLPYQWLVVRVLAANITDGCLINGYLPVCMVIRREAVIWALTGVSKILNTGNFLIYLMIGIWELPWI